MKPVCVEEATVLSRAVADCEVIPAKPDLELGPGLEDVPERIRQLVRRRVLEQLGGLAPAGV